MQKNRPWWRFITKYCINGLLSLLNVIVEDGQGGADLKYFIQCWVVLSTNVDHILMR